MRYAVRREARVAVSVLCCLLAVPAPVLAGQGQYPMGMVGGRMQLKEGAEDVLVVTSIMPDMPGARAGLRVGDEIVSVSGKPLAAGYMMPFRMFGSALVEAEAADGELALGVRRKDKTQEIVVRLPKRGAFAATFPFDCPKAQKIHDVVCENLKSEFARGGGLRGGPVTNAYAVMGLLGHRSGRYDSVVKPFVMKVAEKHAAGDPETSVWLLSYAGVMLCEYYALYPEDAVKAGIEAIAKRLAGSIPDHGRYGHHLRPNRNEIAYDGQGLNGTTTAALWFFASAARCGIDQALFKDAFEKAFNRVRAETNKEGGVGYAWPGNEQSCMRSGQTGLATYHLLLTEGLIDREDPALIEYDHQVGTWPSRFPDVLLEAHAVSSMGIATSTASLAAHDREKYIQLMRAWQWWLALSYEPAGGESASSTRFAAAYVGGPNNTGGDFYLNGHRDLTKDFNTIMHATVAFMLSSTHGRLSFYSGMLPIPGVTSAMRRSRVIRAAYDAARDKQYVLAMRTCAAVLKKGKRATDIERSCARAIYDYVEKENIAPAFEGAKAALAGEDKYLGREKVLEFARTVKGVREYEEKTEALLETLETDGMRDFLAVGKAFYRLKDKVRRVPAKLRPGIIRQFIEENDGHYYAGLAEKLLAETAGASGADAGPSAVGAGAASRSGRGAAGANARPRVGRRPTEEGLREFDGRLKARLVEALRMGKKPVFTYSKLRTRMRVLKLGEGDVVFLRGLRIPISSNVEWPSLATEDKANLALGLLREGVAPDHAVAAFFLFASGRPDDARGHLARAGEKSGVPEAFGD